MGTRTRGHPDSTWDVIVAMKTKQWTLIELVQQKSILESELSTKSTNKAVQTYIWSVEKTLDLKKTFEGYSNTKLNPWHLFFILRNLQSHFYCAYNAKR